MSYDDVVNEANDWSDEAEFLGYDCGLDLVASTSAELHREVAELARRVHSETRLHYEPVAAQFASLATTHIHGVAEAGALLFFGRTGWSCVSELETDAALIEQLHKDVGDGPAIQATQTQQVVHVADLTAETRWPHFVDIVVSRTPMRSMLCLPLYTHLQNWGALALFGRQPGCLGSDAEQAGSIVATHAALALDAMHHDRQYRSALGSRDIIGQAKGMLMERFDVDAAAAFALLTRLAGESHRPVVVVAKEMLEKKSGTDT